MKNLVLLVVGILAFTVANAQIPSWLPANGLVAWYPFNNNANDESGHGNNGTSYNATLTTDRLGNSNGAYAFNGSSSYIEIPDAVSLRSNYISVALWANVSSNAVYQLVYKAGITNAQAEAYSMRAANGAYGFDFKMNSNCVPSNGWKVSNYGTVQTNTWVFLTCTYDGDSVREYVNGMWVASKYYPGAMDTCIGGNLRFGYAWNSYPTPLNGMLDDIAIYNRALSVCEIQQLYTQTSAAIATQPVTQTVPNGSTVHFSINTATASSVLYYQWQQNTGTGFVNLSNAGIYSNTASNTLAISPINAALNNSIYRCIVGSTSVCPDTSDEAVLKINFSGIDEVSGKPKLMIAPNPANDQVSIMADKYFIGKPFTLTNGVGQIVRNGKLQLETTELKIEDLSAGVYYLRLEGNGDVYKIVKL